MNNKLVPIKKFLNESLNLSGKLFGIYLILAVLLSLWISYYTESLLKVHLQNQLEEQGHAIAKNIADISVNYVLTENVHGLKRLLLEQKAANSNIEYILVFDWNLDLFAHSLPVNPSSKLLEVDNESLQVIKTDRGNVWEFATPITEYYVGTVRVGISETKQLGIVKTILSNILVSLMIFFFISAIVVTSLHRILTKPITELVKVTQNLSKGNFQYRVPHHDKNDEMGVLISSFNQMIDDLEKYKKETDNLEKKRRLLLEKIINLQEDERKIIAMELHDETGQSLTGVKLNLKSLEQSVEDPIIKEQVAKLHTQVSQSLSNIHDLIVDIGPRYLEGENIGKILERYVNDYQQRYKVQVSLELKGIVEIELVNQAKASVFRIMQEAMTNTAKYAKATELFISLQVIKTHLLLIIEDNGVGFEAEKEFSKMSSSKNMGLFSMKERAALLGGTFLVESVIGEGTTVYVRIPLTEVIINDTHTASG
ncbi:hypothetical protein BHU72_07320 [Desulfuribacillus stibiiarsenatis]|uniref:Oxygen sensor histidine kinase NreB n=1 Tax=Desulfuribacillus stibiiarsenatis TaxID=1390249 RepID=A0A1E5L4D4_9FIRM|nr:HAMP domain-containing protein [Desulfuribacillus stibiiarsenatis]OEH84992.1 hypothetical protein BHU72_07320 [Desulfuribacillus stibiiarsenatis]